MSAQAVRLSNVDINNALENKDFEVLFQPIFDLGNGALARMETFVRWRHPSLGVLPPGAFISFFESQGRMCELTRYILSAALDGYAEWRGPFAPGFSVNLSLADLADETFASHLATELQAHEFPADLITLECPMPPVDSDLEGMIDRFSSLRETGARLAIEVRGRASDFLRTVDPFPFDEIKTGGSSILRFARTVRGPGLSAISDLLDIAKKANAVTTAVGVEDQASLSALRDLGFTAAQGNHLAKVGALADFRPARVNHVRELLELPALSGDELTALFRTAAPSPKAAEDAEEPTKHAMQQADAPENAENAPAEPAESDEDKQALVARARKKAKAIALTKRAKARDARKAAAIKRAKAKVALAKKRSEAGEDTHAQEVSENPRELQDRITQEFTDGPGDEGDAEVTIESVETTAADNPGDSKPEGGESLMAHEEPKDHSKAPNADAVSDEADVSLNMPVGAARVYFRPGMSVRTGLAPDEGGHTAAAPAEQPAEEKPEETASAALPVDIAFADDSVEDEEASPPDADTFSPDSAEAEAPSPIEEDGDAVTETHDEAVAESPEHSRQKNLLQRRYKFPPKHFWPKPWKRAWRRHMTPREEAGV